MLINKKNRQKLARLFEKIKLDTTIAPSGNKNAKIEQIIAYLEMVHACLRKYSCNKPLTLVDCAAGNCYLSFLIYYFYRELEPRNVSIHCIDTNGSLMENAKTTAAGLGFRNMYFHTGDILEFSTREKVQLVYSLHACDTATDKTLYLGIKQQAVHILSVSCCQHSLKKQLKKHPVPGLTRHKVFKDKITYMVADTLRSLLLESRGYRTDMIEFVSSRYTGKNIMLRAVKGSPDHMDRARDEYVRMVECFNMRPCLEKYLAG